MTRDAVIVSAVRTPVGKAKRGGLATVRPDDLAVAVIKELLKRTPGLKPEEIEAIKAKIVIRFKRLVFIDYCIWFF